MPQLEGQCARSAGIVSDMWSADGELSSYYLYVNYSLQLLLSEYNSMYFNLLYTAVYSFCSY